MEAKAWTPPLNVIYTYGDVCSLTVVCTFFHAFFFRQFSSAVSILTFYQKGITVGVCCAVFVSVLNTKLKIYYMSGHSCVMADMI